MRAVYPETGNRLMTPDDLYSVLKKIHIGEQFCPDELHEMCRNLFPLIREIEELKKEKQAIILAHSYVRADILYSVADCVGDSYGLSKEAMNSDKSLIVFAAVRFMGETAKILNPEKDVLIPALEPGCSLADSITGKDVKALKEKFPDYTFICYINTTAEVKAECDVCVTSSNVYDIVERHPAQKIYFVPDQLMGENIIKEMSRRGVKKSIKLWKGSCHVHEEYDPATIRHLKIRYPDLKVLVHPECVPAVIDEADFIGSTSQLLTYIRESRAKHYLVYTECGLISRLEAEVPGKNIVGTCQLCRYMKSNSLAEILRVLKHPREEDYIRLDPILIEKAARSIRNMFSYAEIQTKKKIVG